MSGISSRLTLLLVVACGLIVANIYYAQPLLSPISASIGLSPRSAGTIMTLTQLGYGAGLLFIVPLGDVVENRRLVLALLGGTVLALAGAAMSTQAASFLAAALLVGICSVAVQLLVLYAAQLAPEATRGRAVGNVMSGLMLGIMLARPTASFVTHLSSWHAVFGLSAAVMAGLAIILRFMLPTRWPAPGLRYGALLASMGRLARHTPVLQRRAIYHACLFANFSLFWTTVPLLLADRFHLTQQGIALFALAGVAGAVSAPVAGRLADRGWTRSGTRLAMIAVAGSMLLGQLGVDGSGAALAILVLTAIVLDFGVTANLVFGQRAIFALGAEFRSRLNGLYMATFFGGGAVGSALGAWSYAAGGWRTAMGAGFAITMIALAYALTEPRKPASG